MEAHGMSTTSVSQWGSSQFYIMYIVKWKLPELAVRGQGGMGVHITHIKICAREAYENNTSYIFQYEPMFVAFRGVCWSAELWPS